MKTALLAAGLLALPFAVHLAWWRLSLPRRQTAVLLCLFFGVLAVWLAASVCMPKRWFAAADFWQAVHVAVFFAAFVLAYVVAYSAIEHRSPSMTLLVAVADSGPKGRTREELRSLLSNVSPVEIRLEAMVKDGMIARDGEGYRLLTKGQIWAAVLSAWRGLLGMPRGG